MRQFYFTILFSFFSMISIGQSFLNGNFESNLTKICRINDITNSEFDSIMSNVRGIGASQEIDIYYDIDCPKFGTAQSGNYFVSVENNSSDSTQSTGISLKLTDTLQLGGRYNLTFYDKGLLPGAGPVVIGISNTDSTFGSVIYNSPNINSSWTIRTVSFNAPITARYITVKYGGFKGGAFVDNFAISSTTGINHESSEKVIFQVFPNPAQSVINIKVESKLIGESYKVIDNAGRVILTGIINSENTLIDLGNISGGIYMFSVGINMKQTFKIIKAE